MLLRENYRDGYAERFVEDWWSGNFPRYLFGTNKLAQDVAKEMEVDGFINTVSEDVNCAGKKLFHSLIEIPEDSLVLVCNVLARVNYVDALLSRYSFRHLEAPRFCRHSKLEAEIPYFKGFAEDIKAHTDEYAYIHKRLADKKSQNIFYNLLNYRLSGDWRYLRGFTDRRDEQYFEDFLQLSEAPIFADIGGYHGETSLEFIKRYPTYKHIYFFEPEVANMSCAKKSLNGFDDIDFIEIGCSDYKGNVEFLVDGSASKINQTNCGLEGRGTITVDRFDNIVSGRVDYIKMDIEGAEGGALTGMGRTIAEWHPTLAVCMYHRADDFRKLTTQILGVREDYKMFLRHYGDGVTETVMFFVP